MDTCAAKRSLCKCIPPPTNHFRSTGTIIFLPTDYKTPGFFREFFYGFFTGRHPISIKTNIMAEINQPNQKSRKGRAFFSKKSVRVDLTPLVDLGFILVTFFVFTSTLSELKAMDMLTPNDSDSSTDNICASCALTFIPVSGDSIWYYEGIEEKAAYQLAGIKEVRNIILHKKNAVKQLRKKDELQVIIKGSASAEFKDIIDLIDE